MSSSDTQFKKGEKAKNWNGWIKGQHPSLKTEFKKGQISWNKGKKEPEEITKKRSLLLKGKPNLKKRKEKHKTDESKIWRKRIEFRLWREAVFARDNWTCQKCKVKGWELHPHHIQNFAQYLELRFAIDNGIAFCEKCHKLFHKIFGKINNNKGQIIEFLAKNYV